MTVLIEILCLTFPYLCNAYFPTHVTSGIIRYFNCVALNCIAVTNAEHEAIKLTFPWITADTMLSLKCTIYTHLRYEQYILKIWLVLQNWNVFPTVPSCITVVKNKYPPNMPFKLCSSPLHHSNLPLKNKKAQRTGCTPLATKHEFFPLDIALGVHVLCIHVIWLSFRESNALICYPLRWLPSYTTNSQFVAIFTYSKNGQHVREGKAETYRDLRGCVERRRLQTGRVKAHLKVRVNLSRKPLPWGTYGEGRKKMRGIPEPAIKGCVKLLALGFDLHMHAPTHAHTYTPCLQRQRALFYGKRSSLMCPTSESKGSEEFRSGSQQQTATSLPNL